MPIAVQNPDRVVLFEVLPLQQCARVHLDHGFNECLDKLVVGPTAQSGMAPPRVQRVT